MAGAASIGGSPIRTASRFQNRCRLRLREAVRDPSCRSRCSLRQDDKRSACDRRWRLATVGSDMGNSIKVILASGSPRRRQLLAGAGIEFEVIESMVPEKHVAGEPARDYALRMARDKAIAVSSRFREAIVVGADT